MKASWSGSVTLAAVLLVGAVVVMRQRPDEAGWCRSVFSQLVHGRSVAIRHIAWDRLQLLDADIGAEYRMLAEKDRARYCTVFVNNFGKGFHHVRGQGSAFTHWRVYGRDQRAVIVAADHAPTKGTLLFRVTHDGAGRRIEGIQWQAPDMTQATHDVEATHHAVPYDHS